MRLPPPVSVQLPDEPSWRVVCAVVPAVPVWTTALWLMDRAGAGLGAWLLAGALAIGVAVAVHRRRRPEAIELAWDGAAWRCRSVPPRAGAPPRHGIQPASTVRPSVRIDLGLWMLLRLERVDGPTAGVPRWWAVSRRGAGTAWTALRAALYCAPLGPPPNPSSG